MIKIVVLGGTGLLGTELKKIDKSIICLGSEIQIQQSNKLWDYLDEIRPDILVNAAAITETDPTKVDKLQLLKVNIQGATTVAMYCLQRQIRLVYISTDYVYKPNGNNSEESPLFPESDYTWSKLGGECATRLVPNSCIVRTSFGASKFKHEQAYTNLFTSKDYVDVIAPKIMKVITSEISGIVNVGTCKKSVYDYVKERNPDIIPSQLPIPKDYSLQTTKYDSLFRN